MPNLVDRLNRHPVIFLLTMLGSLASIIGLVVVFVPRGDSPPEGQPQNQLAVEEIVITDRKPVWGWSFFDDEIIVVVKGRCRISRGNMSEFKLVAFWRLANGFETNWHIGKRRVGMNYTIAMLDGQSAIAGKWDFIVGGIQADKSYSGAIAITVAAVSTKAIESNERKWLGDESGWGFADLPGEGRLAVSAPATFKTESNR